MPFVYGVTQPELNYKADNLDVRVKLTDNLVYDGKRHSMIITLVNRGNRAMDMRKVEMYFHSLYMVEPDYLPDPGGYQLADYHVRLDHIKGMLFRMKFLRRFGIMMPNDPKEIKLTVQDWGVSKTDVPNNWYLVAKGLDAKPILSTTVEDQSFVEDFVDPNQYKRYRNDQYSPFSPLARFDHIKGDDLGPAISRYTVIPTPKEVMYDTANPVVIDDTWVISTPPALLNEAHLLRDKLGLKVVDAPVATNAIILEIGNTGYNDKDSYVIKTFDCADVISIKGGSSSGVFYGAQTLISLLTDNGTISLGRLPGMVIIDEPRFEYRGVHLDVARNFHPKETVNDLIDTMAHYKLNKLHLHLSDDEAWRLEIPKLPELTSVAGRRCHDLKETSCILPQLGSGPLPLPPGSGYYKREDYRDILRHAAKNHVEIIPEFQMPSHAHAAIKAMEERFRRTNDIDHLLTDLDDKSEYMSVQMFDDDAMNPCIESTYNFVKVVINTIKNMHIGITPLEVFNLGGEAVPEGAWVNSTACRKAFPNVAPEDLPVYAKAYFMSRLAKMVIIDEGLRIAGYEDAFFLNGEPLPGGSDNLLVYPYQNVWEWGLANRAYKLANAGYPVVMSPVTHLSFDHPYEPDPNEPGFYWASRYLDTQKVFSLRPEHLYNNIDVKRSGEPLTRLDVCGVNDVNCDPLRAPNNIKGLQSFGWTEIIKDKDTLQSMLFPRMLALAERAWHKEPWENTTVTPERDYEMFANKVGYRELPKLDRDQVKYRIPMPGVSVATNNNRDFQINMKAEFPNLQLQYSSDGGATWTDYTRPFIISDVNKMYLLRTLSTDGLRSSRVASFAINDIIGQKK
ncbi:hypothetical protein ACF0H5_013169 [Mactra antiquata]